MSDIVERLRNKSGQYDECDWHSAIEIEAADTIEQLRAENARLKMDKEKIRDIVWGMYNQGPEAIDLALAELATKEQS